MKARPDLCATYGHARSICNDQQFSEEQSAWIHRPDCAIECRDGGFQCHVCRERIPPRQGAN